MRTFLPFLIFYLFISCQKDEEVVALRFDTAEAVEATTEADYAEAVPESPKYDEAKMVDSPSETTTEPKIIKNARLKFETEDIETSRSQIQKAINANKASVQHESETKNDYSIRREMTIRVPSKNFESFINTVGKGVSFFEEKEISANDVTAEFIDTEARLRTKKVLEARYLELLKKAGKVSEMLEIEQKLSEIREEIESTEGQLKYMQSQISMSSVNIEFYKTSPSESGVTKSFGSKMGNALETGFLGLSSLFLWLLEVWPFIIILMALFFFIRRRFKRKKT